MTQPLDFEPLFAALRDDAGVPPSEQGGIDQPDRRDGSVYELSPELHLAVEVALTTGRPLLLRGDPGTGKSSLAPYVARRLGWRYYEQVVTSQTTATDLLWHEDSLRRLADAQVGQLRPDGEYVRPGVLWWALDRPSALRRPGAAEPNHDVNAGRDQDRAVVLIDEIDKAYPDMPNGLLVALGSNRFEIPYSDSVIERRRSPVGDTGTPPVSPELIVLTSNEERELPPAFVRRCISFRLPQADAATLVRVARRHFAQPFTPAEEALAGALAVRVEELRATVAPGERPPSTAEFLDAFRACRAHRITPTSDDPRWLMIEQLTLAKPDPAAW